MMASINKLFQVAAGIIEPPPDRTADQWADQCRVLPPDSPEPGAWRSSRTPYMIPIMRAFSDDGIDCVVGIMGAQMGKTENYLNIIGHVMSDSARPMLFIAPTEKLARSMASDRLDKMILSTPALYDALDKGRAKNKILEKFINGARLGFAWAGSPTELASHPAAVVLIDERSRMGNDSGNEGDPYLLARARTKNYRNSTVGVFSTPTIEGVCPTWALFDLGTMGKWAVECQACQVYFVPCLELLQWESKATPQRARETARLVCPSCGYCHTDVDKGVLNKTGRYEFHVFNEAGEPVAVGDKPPKNRMASYWVSGLMSPWQTFGEIAEVMAMAYQTHADETIQAAINTYAGELFKMRGETVSDTALKALIQPYAPRTLNHKIQLITLGCDVQKRGLYYVVRGWGFNSESWLLDYGYLVGETAFDEVWIVLGRTLEQDLQGKRINRAFIDSGYNPRAGYRRPDNQVYNFCRRYIGLAYAAKGHETQDRPLKTSKIDVNVAGVNVPGGLILQHIDTDYYKTWLHSRWAWPEGQPGGFHLHQETGNDYIDQLRAEELVIKASGRRVWVQTKKDNHYLDCEVLAAAAASSLSVHALKDLAKPNKTQQHAIQTTRRPAKKRQGLFG